MAFKTVLLLQTAAVAIGQPTNYEASSLQPQITSVNHQIAAGIATPLEAAPSHCSVASSVLQQQGLGANTATYDGATILGYLNAFSGHSPILEKIHSLPPLQAHLTYAPMYTSNGALTHMPLGPIHTSLPDPLSQVGLNSRFDQLTWRADDQNNLIGQLLRHINLNQGPNLGSHDKEKRIHEHNCEHFERSQTGRTKTNRQGR
ncbi:unnamed protein product [Prunus armeniaca]